MPDSVANQIAAGEVIQRPASVVKELVENAIDAGARSVTVRVMDAGRTLIQVIDDGSGMSETDARLAFERHSTSKIRQASDLFSLRTMGFRGEALASIAAVAQVELRTRLAAEDIGTRLRLAGGKVLGQEPVSCPAGSNFSVENLFFNVPARRRFLKSNSTELNNILTAFERIVLVYPHVGFTFYSNDTEVMSLRPCGVRQRIVEVFGKKLNEQLLPIAVDTSVCRISGFVGKPEAARKKGARQYFFTNGRYMRHPYFNKAVQGACERLVPVGGQVPYFIYIEVDPGDIDVNIHPTKTEIKFENEQVIWQILSAAVKEAVGKFSGISSLDFDTQGKPDIPVFRMLGESQPPAPRVGGDPSYNPFKPGAEKSRWPSTAGWEEMYEGLQKPEASPAPLFTDEGSGGGESLAGGKSPMHYQYKGRYIMTAVKSGLMIIDQRRAHVRVLYDKYMRQMERRTAVTQRVLFPEVMRLPPSDAAVMERLLPGLESAGFDIASLGGGSYAVNGVPAELAGADVPDIVRQAVSSAGEGCGGGGEEMRHTLALSLARSAAIPYGQTLGNDEMESLVNGLFACGDASHAPDGKTILCILGEQDMEKLMR